MSKERMKDRLRNLSLVPRMAAQDHRFFLDEQGEDSRLKSLSRRERRKIAKGGRWLAGEYAKRMRQIAQSGAGYSGTDTRGFACCWTAFGEVEDVRVMVLSAFSIAAVGDAVYGRDGRSGCSCRSEASVDLVSEH